MMPPQPALLSVKGFAMTLLIITLPQLTHVNLIVLTQTLTPSPIPFTQLLPNLYYQLQILQHMSESTASYAELGIKSSITFLG